MALFSFNPYFSSSVKGIVEEMSSKGLHIPRIAPFKVEGDIDAIIVMFHDALVFKCFCDSHTWCDLIIDDTRVESEPVELNKLIVLVGYHNDQLQE